jgi:hypothetical protein
MNDGIEALERLKRGEIESDEATGYIRSNVSQAIRTLVFKQP